MPRVRGVVIRLARFGAGPTTQRRRSRALPTHLPQDRDGNVRAIPTTCRSARRQSGQSPRPDDLWGSDGRPRGVPSTHRQEAAPDRDVEESGFDLEDVYSGGRTWTDLRREVTLPTREAGPNERLKLRATGRLLHVDDGARITAWRTFLDEAGPPDGARLKESERCLVRMLVAQVTRSARRTRSRPRCGDRWAHPHPRAEIAELLGVPEGRIDHVRVPPGIDDAPLLVHARYTRAEIRQPAGRRYVSQRTGWTNVCSSRASARWTERSGAWARRPPFPTRARGPSR